MENNEQNVMATEINNTPTKTSGLAIASMILGIISILLCCAWYITAICAILAIIFGIMSIKKPGKGMAIAGIVTGAIGLLIAIIIGIMAFTVGFSEGMLSSRDSNSYTYNRNFSI